MVDPPGNPPPGPAVFEIPDLDLAAPPRPAAREDSAKAKADPDPFGNLEIEGFPGTAATAGAASSRSLDYSGAGTFDADDFDDVLQHGSGRLDLADLPTDSLADAPARSERWPTGCSPERGAIAVDAAELKLIADYGDPPTALYLAPRYAWRVYSRQRALRAELARADAELIAAEQARDRLLGAMVETLAPALAADDRMRSVLEPVQRLDAITRERGAALASTNADYRQQAGQLDTERASLQEQADAQRAVVEQHRAEHERRDESFRRVEARFKRSQIELRNAQQAAAQAVETAGPGATIPPEHANRILQIQAQAVAIEPELEQVRGERDAARAVLDAAQRQIDVLKRALQSRDHRQRALDEQFGKQIDVRAQGVQEAERERETALADAGRAVLRAHGTLAIEPTTLQALHDTDANVEHLTRESEKRLRALDIHNRDVVRRGYLAVTLALGLIVLLVVLAIVL